MKTPLPALVASTALTAVTAVGQQAQPDDTRKIGGTKALVLVAAPAF